MTFLSSLHNSLSLQSRKHNFSISQWQFPIFLFIFFCHNRHPFALACTLSTIIQTYKFYDVRTITFCRKQDLLAWVIFINFQAENCSYCRFVCMPILTEISQSPFLPLSFPFSFSFTIHPFSTGPWEPKKSLALLTHT